MADFEIIGVPQGMWFEWVLDASAHRSYSEVRVATALGPKLAGIDNFRLATETKPDDTEYIFGGNLGRFSVNGTANVITQHGNLHVVSQRIEDEEVVSLLKDNAFLTIGEWFTGEGI